MAPPYPEAVITRDLREAIARAVAAAGLQEADPGLRPAGVPGRYAASVAFELGVNPREIARRLATHLAREPWITQADVTGPGYLTITVTPETLIALADRIAEAGPDSARSDALRGVTLPAPPAAELAGAATWEEAREALAVELTARLAVAAGATLSGRAATATGERHAAEVASAIAFAGLDAVRFSLARAAPGRPVRIDREIIARHVQDNPAYAVRYAHARAASGVRWAATPGGAEAVPRRLPADPGELALLDALSWLPERVATAARRGRPDEFARYLEELASVTIATLSSVSYPGSARAPGSDRLALARAAQAGLAAGLELLGVSAPDRM